MLGQLICLLPSQMTWLKTLSMFTQSMIFKSSLSIQQLTYWGMSSGWLPPPHQGWCPVKLARSICSIYASRLQLLPRWLICRSVQVINCSSEKDWQSGKKVGVFAHLGFDLPWRGTFPWYQGSLLCCIKQTAAATWNFDNFTFPSRHNLEAVNNIHISIPKWTDLVTVFVNPVD